MSEQEMSVKENTDKVADTLSKVHKKLEFGISLV